MFRYVLVYIYTNQPETQLNFQIEKVFNNEDAVNVICFIIWFKGFIKSLICSLFVVLAQSIDLPFLPDLY